MDCIARRYGTLYIVLAIFLSMKKPDKILKKFLPREGIELSQKKGFGVGIGIIIAQGGGGGGGKVGVREVGHGFVHERKSVRSGRFCLSKEAVL